MASVRVAVAQSIAMLLGMKPAKLTHITLMAGLLLGSAAHAEDTTTITIDPTVEIVIDPVEEIVVDVPASSEPAPVTPSVAANPAPATTASPQTPATATTAATATTTPATTAATATTTPATTAAAATPPAPTPAAPAGSPATQVSKPTTPAQIVAMRLQNTVQPRLSAADILAQRSGAAQKPAPTTTAPQPEVKAGNTEPKPTTQPDQTAPTALNTTPNTPAPSAPATPAPAAGSQGDPAKNAPATLPTATNTVTTAPVDEMTTLKSSGVPGQTLPVLNALSADRRVFAPTQARATDLSQAGVLNAQAFMTVTASNNLVKGSIGYTISNPSGVAGISDASRIRLTLNGVDITGRLSRVNTSRQDGYLAPGTMETGVIDLDQLEPGELILEWRINTASTGGEQILRYRWTLVERTLNLPGARQ